MLILSQARCEHTRRRASDRPRTREYMCLFWIQRLSAATSQEHLRAINNNVHCSTWVSKDQRLVELFRHPDVEQECLWRIRQGLLEGAVLRPESFPHPLRLHSKCALKPSNTIDSAITTEKITSRTIIHLAGVEVLVTLKKQREILLLEQHYSIACPWWGFIRHRCCAPAKRGYV